MLTPLRPARSVIRTSVTIAITCCWLMCVRETGLMLRRCMSIPLTRSLIRRWAITYLAQLHPLISTSRWTRSPLCAFSKLTVLSADPDASRRTHSLRLTTIRGVLVVSRCAARRVQRVRLPFCACRTRLFVRCIFFTVAGGFVGGREAMSTGDGLSFRLSSSLKRSLIQRCNAGSIWHHFQAHRGPKSALHSWKRPTQISRDDAFTG